MSTRNSARSFSYTGKSRFTKARRPQAALDHAVLECLEWRVLFSWIGATSGTTNDAAHNYNSTANWAGGVIDDSFSGVTLSANTTLYFTANRTVGASGLNLNYSGNVNLTFMSSSATA